MKMTISILPIIIFKEKSPRDIMKKVLDCDIVVGENELKLCYCVHFRTNTRGGGMKS